MSNSITTAIVHSNLEMEQVPDLVQAKEISLYSQESVNAPYNSLAGRFKGIVDANNVETIFNVVSPAYKIAQHSEVHGLVIDALQATGFKCKVRTEQYNDGARMRVSVGFPDIMVKIDQEVITLRMAIDNSYNSTTGLRVVVSGERARDNVLLSIPDSFAFYYHKHFGGMDVNNIGPSIDKGVSIFLTKVKEKWEKYFHTKIDPVKARDFLEQCDRDKTISKKYLKMMLERMNLDATVKGLQITNQWLLHGLVSEILSKECKSKDTMERLMTTMDNKINSNISNLD